MPSAILAANIAFVRQHQEGQSGGGDRRADVRSHAAARTACGGDVEVAVSRRRPKSGLRTTGIDLPDSHRSAAAVAAARTSKRRIDDFETVMNSRWPTTQDMRLPGWGRTLLKSLSSWRYAAGAYNFPANCDWRRSWCGCVSRGWRACDGRDPADARAGL